MELKLNNSDEGGGIHNAFSMGLQKKLQTTETLTSFQIVDDV